MNKKTLSRRNFIKKSTLAVTGSALVPSILKANNASAGTGSKQKMFCYQCEQTMGGKGCTRIGVCGKTPDVAALQDLLIHTLKGLSIAAVAGRKVNISDPETNRFTCMALFSTLTNVEFDPYRFEDLLSESIDRRDKMIQQVKTAGGSIKSKSDALTLRLKPTLEGMIKQGKQYGLMSEPNVNPDVRSLQHLLLFGIKGMGAYTDHAAEHGQEDEANYEFVHRGLAALTDKTKDLNGFLSLVLECGNNAGRYGKLDSGTQKIFSHGGTGADVSFYDEFHATFAA